MPPPRPLKIYLPLAFLIVIALAALIAANPAGMIGWLNPVKKLERLETQKFHDIGRAETALTNQQARDLFEQYRGGNSAAGNALLSQDQRNGLPEEFLGELEALIVESDAADQKLIHLVGRLAEHRAFAVPVEDVFAQAADPPGSGVDSAAINTLAKIGRHRPLTDPTLEVLIGLAEDQGYGAQSALLALQPTAEAHGLPDWALDRLEAIAGQRPGTIGSEAIKVIAMSGDQARALQLLDVEEKPFVDASAVALALPQNDLAELTRILMSDEHTDAIRVGALDRLVKRRDQSDRVGEALTYAFTSDRSALRLAAFTTYTSSGRHHARHISVSWPDVVAAAFDDDDQSMRIRSAEAFRFVSFEDRTQRDAFLLEMLDGSPNQQQSALWALSGLHLVPETIKERVEVLSASATTPVAQQASVMQERYRKEGPLEKISEWLAGAAFLTLLFFPAITAACFATYFVARLLQSLSGTGSRAGILAVSVLWLCLSIALGLMLIMGAMGLHGNTGSELYVFLLVVNVIFAGIGWVLTRAIRSGDAIAPEEHP
jgi:hypothetical protein